MRGSIQSYLDIAKQALQQHKAGGGEPRVKNHEFNETNETNEFTQVCRACLCDTYDIRPGESCAVCEYAVCVRCAQCLRASMIWRRAQIDALYQDVPASELLQRLQGGSRWLRDQDLLYFDGDREQAANDELFSKMWAIWSDLELALRHIHQYQGCIFGPGKRCPVEGVVLCAACDGEKPR